MDKYHFFWQGILSQWYPSQFKCRRFTYNCCEQWMMAQKAELFHDYETHDKIMLTDDPRIQKNLGRRVKNFDLDLWNIYARPIVRLGNELKFRQNPQLKEFLMSTENKILVEASPYDCIWGIGLGEDNPDRFDEAKWRGTNWLGECLMDVRYSLGMVGN